MEHPMTAHLRKVAAYYASTEGQLDGIPFPHVASVCSIMADRIEALQSASVTVKLLDDDQIMEIIQEVAPWKSEPKLNDLLTYEKSPPMFPQATYDVPSYRATALVRAVERRVLSALHATPDQLEVVKGEDEADEPEKCFICNKPFKAGAMVLNDVNEGLGHRACFGEDRDGYVKDMETGEPLGPDDPIPTRWPYEPDAAPDEVASGDQMEVVACIPQVWLDYIVKHPGVNTYITKMRGEDKVPLVTLDAAQNAITAANERAERAERERDEYREERDNLTTIVKTEIDSVAGAELDELEDRVHYAEGVAQTNIDRANAAETLVTTLSEALEMAKTELWEMGATESEHNALWHVRAALAALPAKQGGQSDEA